jgi:hypothetical protein
VFALGLAFLVLQPVPAQAYIGPGSGVEFIPQFLALLAFVGAAATSILLRPFLKLMRFVRGKKCTPDEVQPETPAVTVPEAPGEGSHDRP